MSNSKKQTIGYRYSLGEHLVLVHGPVDKCTRLRWDERVAWQGASTGGRIDVDAANLFGGDKREGGVSGAIDFETGAPAQGRNSYLQAKLGAEIPAFRTVASLVFRQLYLGNNPYLKPMDVRLQRIHVRQDGLEQWYDGKSQIGGQASADIPIVPLPGTDGPVSTTHIIDMFSFGPGRVIVTNAGGTSGGWLRVYSYDFESDEWVVLGELALSLGAFTSACDLGNDRFAYSQHTQPIKVYQFTGSGFTQLASLASGASGSERFMERIGENRFAFFSTNTANTAKRLQAIEFSGDSLAVKSTLTFSFGKGGLSSVELGENVFGLAVSQDALEKWIYDPLAETWTEGAGWSAGGLFNLGFVALIEPGILASRYNNELRIIRLNDDGSMESLASLSGADAGGTGTTETIAKIDSGVFGAASREGTRILRAWSWASVYDGCPSMNPAHIIRECLTDPDWGMGYPEDAIDDASFTVAADQLFAEQMGISILWDRESTIQDFVDLITQHIDAALYVSRTTGKFVLKLIRSDYDVATIQELGEGEIERVDNYSRPAFGELINEITVNYWDCKMSKTATVTAHNDALIQLQGGVIGTTISYPGFTNAELAGRVALRDLNALSRQLASCTIYANREAAQLEIGDVFKLVWPDTHDGYIVMRVTGMAFGDGRTNKIRIECVEDVFALPGQSLTVEPETEWVNPSQVPEPATRRLVIEAPYYEVVRELGEVDAAAQLAALPEAGWLTATADRPAGALNATLTVDVGTGYEDQAIVDFCPMADLAAAVGPTDTVWTIDNPIALDELRIGSWAQIDDEIVRIDAASDTSITVGRGCLDTVPTAHAVDAPIFFAQDFIGAGETTYVDSDVLNAKLLPGSGAGQVSISQAATDVVTMDQRANRPYAPGNFQIDGAAYPTEFTRTATTTITWSHRDRLQQTGGAIEDTTDGNIGPEAGTTYNVQLLDPNNADALIAEQTGITVTSAVFDTSAYAQTAVKFSLWSVRGGVASWQRHEWTADVESAFAEVAPVTLTAPSATASTA